MSNVHVLRQVGLLETICFQATNTDNHWKIINNNQMEYTNMITRRHYNTYGSKQ